MSSCEKGRGARRGRRTVRGNRKALQVQRRARGQQPVATYRKPQQQTRLSDPRISNQQKLQRKGRHNSTAVRNRPEAGKKGKQPVPDAYLEQVVTVRGVVVMEGAENKRWGEMLIGQSRARDPGQRQARRRRTSPRRRPDLRQRNKQAESPGTSHHSLLGVHRLSSPLAENLIGGC